MKGDRIEVLVDVGAGVERFEIEARRAGRRVEVASVRGTVEVTEVTRSGTPVRTARFMAAKVVAVVEHPAGDDETPVRPFRGDPSGHRQEMGTGPGAGASPRRQGASA
ncbi:MAG TPA: hypothetical protein VED84_08810 [Acidimicrobiales bacterium]|nr:hypothetical protein [Acidimicrobiales bacterium]